MDINALADLLKQVDKSLILDLSQLLKGRDTIYLIGNGGSNSICSHISQDYTKVLGLRAQCFSDPSRLTCYINDYGSDKAYSKFLEHFATIKSLVILISSSGNSQNILESARYCVDAKIPFLILTGFDKDNGLRKEFSNKALLDFHVDSYNYGIVESTHLIFLHSVI